MTAIIYSPRGRRKSRWAIAAVSVPFVFALAACGSDKDDSDPVTSGSGSNVNTASAKLVPSEYKDKTVQIAIGTDYPPYHYADSSGKVVGFDPDFAVAIAEDMGIKYEVVPVGFDAIIPGIQAGRYDFAVPGFSITPERAKVLDFVTYVTDQSSYMVAADSGIKVASADNLCGHKWAAAKGTNEETVLQEQAKKCDEDSKGTLDVLSFPSTNDANTAVLSGRADGASAVYSQLAYASAQQSGKFEIQDYKLEAEPLALGLKKGNPLGKAILQAIKDIQENGKYSEVLAKNDVADMEYDSPELVTK